MMMADKFMKGPFGPEEGDDAYGAVPAAVAEEFMLLMSLALDEMLDAEEERRFQDYLTAYPALANEWRSWQELDLELQSTPAALPPDNFVTIFEVRLLQRERRRRLWWGVGLGSLVLLLWVGVMAGAMSLGAFVMFGQSAWLTELVRTLANLGATVDGAIVAAGAALASIFGTEQAQLFITLYALTAVTMLTGWIFFLRRTTRTAVATQVVR